MEDQKIIDDIVKEFEGLAHCPRPSGHEKIVSDYIVCRLEELGITHVVQDELYNVIADVPPTPGCEAMPVTIIQGHMDMVCVAKPDVAYDPLTHAIRLVREGNVLRADGTSLGGDDGVAVAVALFLIQQEMAHGPLRLIFTVDEEVDMTGVRRLDPKYVQDAKYVINLDHDCVDSLGVSSASSVYADYHRKITWRKPVKDCAIAITVKNLAGGHSGQTIHEEKGNAIQALARVLRRLTNEHIFYELSSIAGGDAANAIPSTAEAVVVVHKEDAASVCALVDKEKSQFDSIYGAAERQAVFMTERQPLPDRVFSCEDSNALVSLLLLLHCGVFAMNQTWTQLPDLSANIGIVRTDDEGVAVRYLPRSSSNERLQEFMQTLTIIGEVTGCSVNIQEPFPAWKGNIEGRLVSLFSQAYKKETGRELVIEALHLGLETGYIYDKNPRLDIVSIGATVHALHSVDESIELDTLPLLVRMMMAVLPNLT